MTDGVSRVAVTCHQMQSYLQNLEPPLPGAGRLVFEFPELVGQQFSAENMSTILSTSDYAIVGDDAITSQSIENSPVKGIIKWGIGYDSIDTAALESRKIRFSNTPGQFGPDVAELVLGMILNLERGISRVDAGVRAGEWPKLRGSRVRGKTALVLGYGNLGKEVVSLLSAVGIDCEAYDPYVAEATQGLPPALHKTFPYEGNFDYLVSCLPLVKETDRFIGAKELTVLSGDGFFINVSRGGVVDEKALAQALSDNKIAGAALDVFDEEPLPRDSGFRSLDGVLLGAHNGSNTEEGVREASSVALEILLEWITSEGDPQWATQQLS